MHVSLTAEPALACKVGNSSRAHGDIAAISITDGSLAIAYFKPVSPGAEFRSAFDSASVSAIGQIQHGLSVADEVIVPRGKSGRALGFSFAVEEMNARGSRLTRTVIYYCDASLAGGADGKGAK
jgi:hypothetical protein